MAETPRPSESEVRKPVFPPTPPIRGFRFPTQSELDAELKKRAAEKRHEARVEARDAERHSGSGR